MMNEEQFFESQMECAEMLGMTLSEYQDYCKNVKVSNDSLNSIENNTYDTLDFLGIEKSAFLKTRKDY